MKVIRRLMVGSPIVEISSAGSDEWERITCCDTENYKRLVVKITGQQFSGGGDSAVNGIWARILNAVLPILWPSTIITTQVIKELDKNLMAHLGIKYHDVMGKLVEMHHWHSVVTALSESIDQCLGRSAIRINFKIHSYFLLWKNE